MIKNNIIDVNQAKLRCKRFRKKILDISQQVQALHIGSAYSCTEIVDAIYFELMKNYREESRETFLMSKVFDVRKFDVKVFCRHNFLTSKSL